MIFSVVGCKDNTNPLLIPPDSSNSVIDTEGTSKEEGSGSSTETEDDDSSSNGNENQSSNESYGWTGFY